MRPDWLLWLFVVIFAGTSIGWLTDYYEKVKILNHTAVEHAGLTERIVEVERRFEVMEQMRNTCRKNLSCDMAETALFMRAAGFDFPLLVSEQICRDAGIGLESKNATQERQ